MKYLKKFNEQINTKENLYYTVSEDVLKERNYEYLELFASDIPYYHKKVNEYDIWCRVKNKFVYINDLYGFLTLAAIEFFLENRNNEEQVKYSKMFDYHYISTKINRETGEIITIKNIMKKIAEEMPNATGEERLEKFFNNEYNDNPWHELVFPVEEWNELIEELNAITNNKFKK